ncbi:hypothetical protein EK21DRAFT_92667 [Setomelanomma holmii]|uniref:Hypervirulence associated protein TUDOR domain-containing protein n=1 Tax=Setomelanomma holmii TaxID=210430 RepID=A0A9P4H1Z0_9PLEO|nr:hypothetical protein EK21DRAFT_92667 [Setomelanomma holmii]
MPPKKQASKEESQEEKQYTLNHSKANGARKDAEKSNSSNGSDKPASSQKKDYSNAVACTTHWEDPEHMERNFQAYKDFKGQQGRKYSKDEGSGSEEQAKKRSNGASSSSSNKKQKTNANKHDEPSGTAGSKTRVPQKGQQVQWKALPGYVDGLVVEVVYGEKKVDGKNIKASKEDPRVVLKSDASGKICIHKPEAVYFD